MRSECRQAGSSSPVAAASLLLVLLSSGALERSALGALPEDTCAIAAVVVETRSRGDQHWHRYASGTLQILDDGRVRDFTIRIGPDTLAFALIRHADGSISGNGPDSLIDRLFFHGKQQSDPVSWSIHVSGEIEERKGALKVRVRRQGCMQDTSAAQP
jgi:hypothetical protein